MRLAVIIILFSIIASGASAQKSVTGQTKSKEGIALDRCWQQNITELDDARVAPETFAGVIEQICLNEALALIDRYTTNYQPDYPGTPKEVLSEMTRDNIHKRLLF